MRKIFYILFFVGTVNTGFSQTKRSITPVLTDITAVDSTRNERNELKITIERDYDLFIKYSDITGGGISWMRKQKAFAWRADSGWYSIINRYDLSSGNFLQEGTKQYKTKMSQQEGDSLYNILSGNHFFDMTTEKTMRKGACNIRISDGSLYLFEIFTKKEYKSFLMQGDLWVESGCSSDQRRQQIVTCFSSFEKYLGN